MIRFHPHHGRINGSPTPVLSFDDVPAFIDAIKAEAESDSLSFERDKLFFDLIATADDLDGPESRDWSDAFREFVTLSGFKHIYSVMVGGRCTVGYADADPDA